MEIVTQWLDELSPAQRRFLDDLEWHRRWHHPTDDLERVALPPDTPLPPIDDNLLRLLAILPGVMWDLDLMQRIDDLLPRETSGDHAARALLWARTDTPDPPPHHATPTILNGLMSLMPRRELHTIVALNIIPNTLPHVEAPVWMPISRTPPLCRLALHLAAELPNREQHPAWRSLLDSLQAELQEHGLRHWVFASLNLMNIIPADLWTLCVTTFLHGLDQVQELILSDYVPSMKALLRHTPPHYEPALAFAWLTRMLSFGWCCGTVALELFTCLEHTGEELRRDASTLIALLRRSPLDVGHEVHKVHPPFHQFLFQPFEPVTRAETLQLCRRYPHLFQLNVVSRTLGYGGCVPAEETRLRFTVVDGRVRICTESGFELPLPPGDGRMRLIISLPGQPLSVRTQTTVQALHSHIGHLESYAYVTVDDLPEWLQSKRIFESWLSALELPHIAMRTVMPLLLDDTPVDAETLHLHLCQASDAPTLQDQWMSSAPVFHHLFRDGMGALFRIATWFPNHVSHYVLEWARGVFRTADGDAFWARLASTDQVSVWHFMAHTMWCIHMPWHYVPAELMPRMEMALTFVRKYFNPHYHNAIHYVHVALQQGTLDPIASILWIRPLLGHSDGVPSSHGITWTWTRRLALHAALHYAFTPLERLRWAEMVAEGDEVWLQAPVQANVDWWRERWLLEEEGEGAKSTAVDWHLKSHADIVLCRDPESLPPEFRTLAKRAMPLDDMSLAALRDVARHPWSDVTWRPWSDVCNELATMTFAEDEVSIVDSVSLTCPICCEEVTEVVKCTHQHVACVACAEAFALTWHADDKERCMEVGCDGVYQGTARHPILHRILRRHLAQQIRSDAGYLEAEPTPGQIQAFIDSGGFYVYPRVPMPDSEARSCPGGCMHDMVRTEGCLHMTCPYCRYEFCWGCMGPYHTNFACRLDAERAALLRDVQLAARQEHDRGLRWWTKELRDDMFSRADQLVNDPRSPLPQLMPEGLDVRRMQLDLILKRWNHDALRQLIHMLTTPRFVP